MAIKNVTIGITETNIFTATAETAVLCIMFCNPTSSSKQFSLYAYQAGGTADATSSVLTNVSIPPEDTFIWTANEKFLLAVGDVISAVGDVSGIVATPSYKEL